MWDKNKNKTQRDVWTNTIQWGKYYRRLMHRNCKNVNGGAIYSGCRVRESYRWNPIIKCLSPNILKKHIVNYRMLEIRVFLVLSVKKIDLKTLSDLPRVTEYVMIMLGSYVSGGLTLVAPIDKASQSSSLIQQKGLLLPYVKLMWARWSSATVWICYLQHIVSEIVLIGEERGKGDIQILTFCLALEVTDVTFSHSSWVYTSLNALIWEMY